MILTKHCRGCKCSVCRWQGTDNCLHDVNPYCSRCGGKWGTADRYIALSWECVGFERRQTCTS